MPVQRAAHYIKEIVADGSAARFLVATGASMVFSLGGSAFFTEVIHLPARLSVAAALVLAFLFNFFFLRLFVFRSTAPKGRQLLHFGLTSIGFRGAEYLLFLLLYETTGLPYMISLILSLGLSFVGKFIYHRQVTFR
jgi:putative flippase GtrA